MAAENLVLDHTSLRPKLMGFPVRRSERNVHMRFMATEVPETHIHTYTITRVHVYEKLCTCMCAHVQTDVHVCTHIYMCMEANVAPLQFVIVYIGNAWIIAGLCTHMHTHARGTATSIITTVTTTTRTTNSVTTDDVYLEQVGVHTRTHEIAMEMLDLVEQYLVFTDLYKHRREPMHI